MSTNVENKFDQWFAEEKASGLVDIKLAIASNLQGVSAQAIQDEMMNLEILARNERVSELPSASAFIQKNIEKIIHSVSI